MWQDKMRRLEAHGDGYKGARVFKINALQEYFDLWEADRGTTDVAKFYEELLIEVEDYSRRRKLDSSVKEKMQLGGDPSDVGAVGGWNLREDVGGGYNYDGVYAIGFKRKGKSK